MRNLTAGAPANTKSPSAAPSLVQLAGKADVDFAGVHELVAGAGAFLWATLGCGGVMACSALFMQDALGMGPAPALARQALLERIHEVDDLGVLRWLLGDDGLALLFLFDQIAQRVLIAVDEVLRFEGTCLLLDDLLGDLQHLLVRLDRGDVVEEILFLANLVVSPQGREQKAAAARLDRHDPLAVVHDQAAEGDLVR